MIRWFEAVCQSLIERNLLPSWKDEYHINGRHWMKCILLESLIPLPYQPNDGGRRKTLRMNGADEYVQRGRFFVECQEERIDQGLLCSAKKGRWNNSGGADKEPFLEPGHYLCEKSVRRFQPKLASTMRVYNFLCSLSLHRAGGGDLAAALYIPAVPC